MCLCLSVSWCYCVCVWVSPDVFLCVSGCLKVCFLCLSAPDVFCLCLSVSPLQMCLCLCLSVPDVFCLCLSVSPLKMCLCLCEFSRCVLCEPWQWRGGCESTLLERASFLSDSHSLLRWRWWRLWKYWYQDEYILKSLTMMMKWWMVILHILDSTLPPPTCAPNIS